MLYITQRYSLWGAFILMTTLHPILSSCTKEYKTTYVDISPIMIANSPMGEISAEQFIFHGVIQKLNDENIQEFGLIIRGLDAPDEEITIDMGMVPKIGPFQYSYKPKNKPELGKQFSYYFYIKTDRSYAKSVVYYQTIDGIKINAMGTLLQAAGDTVRIQGDFSKVDERYSVDIKELKAYQIPIVLNKEKTELSFVMPATLGTHNANVSAILNRYESTTFYSHALVDIRTLGHLKAPSMRTYYLNESINLEGVNSYQINNYNNSLRVIIGDQTIPYQREISLSNLKNLKGNTLRIGYLNGRDSVMFPGVITIARATGDLFHLTAKEAHPNTVVRLQFDDFNKFYYNQEVPTLSLTNSSKHYMLKRSVHDYEEYYLDNIPEANYTLQLNHAIGNIASNKMIQVKPFQWSAKKNSEHYIGDMISISGNFIAGYPYTIKLENSDYENEFRAEKDKLTFQIPNIAMGQTSWKIGYKQYNGQLYFPSDPLKITALAPTFDSFSPEKGTAGEIITMKGKAIKYADQIFIGDIPIIPISYIDDEIMFQIPLSISKGKVRLSIVNNGRLISSTNYFEIH